MQELARRGRVDGSSFLQRTENIQPRKQKGADRSTNIHFKTIRVNSSHIFNCGYGKGYSVKEVIDTFNEILDKKISFKIGPRRDGDSKMIVANPTKFNNFFSWKPKFNNLKYILKTAYEWEKKIK